MSLRKWFCVVAAAALTAASPAGAGVIQVGVAVDSSGSVGMTNFNSLKTIIGDAVDAIVPTDSSIELTVVRFGTSVTEIVSPQLITGANKAGVVSAIKGMAYVGGGTNLSGALNSLTSLLTLSSEFSGADASIFDIVTDGVPNSQSASITARNAATTAGIDEIDAEFIGSTTSSGFTFLRDNICYPQSCDTAGFTPGFIVGVTLTNFQDAFENKLRFVTGQTIPEPGTFALLGLGLAGLGFARRRRPV